MFVYIIDFFCLISVFKNRKKLIFILYSRRLGKWIICIHISQNFLRNCLIMENVRHFEYIYVHSFCNNKNDRQGMKGYCNKYASLTFKEFNFF